jgi:hypothetical protein
MRCNGILQPIKAAWSRGAPVPDGRVTSAWDVVIRTAEFHTVSILYP